MHFLSTVDRRLQTDSQPVLTISSTSANVLDPADIFWLGKKRLRRSSMKNALCLTVCLTWLIACSSGVGGTEDQYYQPDKPAPVPAKKKDTSTGGSTAESTGGSSSVAGSVSEGGASEESDAGSPSTGGTEQQIILL